MADAHLALAVVLHCYEWDWPGAEREYRRAIDLNPGDTFARVQYSWLLGQLGQADASVAEARHATDSPPVRFSKRPPLAPPLVERRWVDELSISVLVQSRASL